jgi:Kef-type K+ transport system membrane component KefB
LDAIELAAVLVTVALLASIVTVELGVTVALIELTFGVLAGNAFDLQSQDWLTFIAAFASIVLTFLAGMEVDPAYMRRRLTASVGIGIVSFIGPFVVASAVAYLLLDWSGRASLIAGTALSTTSPSAPSREVARRGWVPHRVHVRAREDELGLSRRRPPLVASLFSVLGASTCSNLTSVCPKSAL